jgi:hypothetical protein
MQKSGLTSRISLIELILNGKDWQFTEKFNNSPATALPLASEIVAGFPADHGASTEILGYPAT